LLGLIKNAEIDKRAVLTDDEVNQVVLKEVKQIQETIKSITPELAEQRPHLIDENVFRLSVVSEYAPKMMDKSEIRRLYFTVVETIGIENPSKSDKGKIMKELMPLVKGKSDGKLVNEVIDGLLQI
jgi:uncharacterized protein YqeY